MKKLLITLCVIATLVMIAITALTVISLLTMPVKALESCFVPIGELPIYVNRDQIQFIRLSTMHEATSKDGAPSTTIDFADGTRVYIAGHPKDIVDKLKSARCE